MTMPQTLKPDELVRPIIGIENRSAQEVFDIMCDRFRHVLALQSDLERVTAERDERDDVLRSLAAYVGNGGYNAEKVDADVFEAKVRDGVDAISAPLDAIIADLRTDRVKIQSENELLRTELRTAEAALVKARTALEPFANLDTLLDDGDDGEFFRHDGTVITIPHVRAARLALSAGEEENGR